MAITETAPRPWAAPSADAASSAGLSSSDTAVPFAVCCAALSALYVLAPANRAFSGAAAPHAPAPLDVYALPLTLESLGRVMQPAFASPPLAFSWTALGERVLSPLFALRCVLGGAAGLVIYVLAASAMHALFPRRPVVAGRERELFNLFSWHSDLALGVLGIVCGSPFLQGFLVLRENFGVSLLYSRIDEGRVALPFGGPVLEGWAWWAASVPLYLVLFDLVFYWTHLMLHWGPIYRYSHANHHAFRPPTAWSGIAIDPLENILTGMLPYHMPLFFFPFHLNTVFAVNIGLLCWATLLHSSCDAQGGWLFIGPPDHNVHHARGLENKNFSAIFSVWDRAFGTLDREGWSEGALVPFWVAEDRAKAQAGALSASDPVREPAPTRADARRHSRLHAGLTLRRAGKA